MPSSYQTFLVYIDHGDNTTTPVASHAVTVYDVTHAVALTSVATDAAGQVAGGTLPVAAGTVVRFSCELTDLRCGWAEVTTGSGVGMDIVLQESGGANIVLRPQARPAWLAPATVEAHQVELWTQDIDPATNALIGVPQLRGRFYPEATVRVANPQDSDRNVRAYFMSLGADGTPAYPSLDLAPQLTVICQRETAAPTVAQVGEATADNIRLAISGFTEYAHKRRVRIADNVGMAGATEIITDAGAARLSNVVDINRGVGAVPANVALASAGATATAQAYTPDGSDVPTPVLWGLG